MTVLFVALLAVGASLVDHFNAPDALAGPFRVVDGDTLATGRERLRLIDIDAPELEQTCLDRYGREWRCGETAREQLRELVRQDGIQCHGGQRDRYERRLVTCEVDGMSINEAMVSRGMAVAGSRRYASEEAEARLAKLGIWMGSFETPRDWRRRMSQDHDEDLEDDGWFGFDRIWKGIW